MGTVPVVLLLREPLTLTVWSQGLTWPEQAFLNEALNHETVPLVELLQQTHCTVHLYVTVCFHLWICAAERGRVWSAFVEWMDLKRHCSVCVCVRQTSAVLCSGGCALLAVSSLLAIITIFLPSGGCERRICTLAGYMQMAAGQYRHRTSFSQPQKVLSCWCFKVLHLFNLSKFTLCL